MKVALLAGGGGTRLSEETDSIPKPLVTVGGRPLLWHIMKHYDHHGLRDFVIALGYKGECIKRYMVDWCTLRGHLRCDLGTGQVETIGGEAPDWRVELIETGAQTETGGRLKRLREFLDDGAFMLTYGDGVSDVDLGALLEFHRDHGRLATLTAVKPKAQFGQLGLEGQKVARFREKPAHAEGWVNGGFFVLEPGVFDYIEGDDTVWERGPLEQLAEGGELMAYRHEGFWQCMDTIHDRRRLQSIWDGGRPPWVTWE
jgi:glucose-1-phosphate cytidylyltransferase